jgi:hypothetical protein
MNNFVIVTKEEFLHTINEAVQSATKADVEKKKGFVTFLFIKSSKKRLIFSEHFILNSFVFYQALIKQKYSPLIIEEALGILYDTYRNYFENNNDFFYERFKEYEDIILEEDPNSNLYLGSAILKNIESSKVEHFEAAITEALGFLMKIDKCNTFLSKFRIRE